MTGDSLYRIAFLNALEPDQGFAGGQTAPLIEQALKLAGFQLIDAGPLLRDDSASEETRVDAWVTLGTAAPEQEAASYCRARGIAYNVIDPSSSAPALDTGQNAPATQIARCFAPEPDSPGGEAETSGNLWYFSPFLDPETFFAAQRDRGGLRQNLSQRHGLPNDSTWIYLSVPRTGNADSLLSTFESLSRLFMHDWTLIVSADEHQLTRVEQLLPCLTGKSRYLLRSGDRQERTGFLAASDLCLSIERSGHEVLDLLEALASGLAIVANKSPLLQEIVENGITGRLSAPGNPASLSNDLTFLFRHDNFLQSYRGNTRAQVVARHDILVAAQVFRDMIMPG